MPKYSLRRHPSLKYHERMSIHYSVSPKNYFELLDSVRGQLERKRELSILGEPMPDSEKVLITTESFMGVLDKIEEMREIINNQMAMFVAVQQILLFIFESMGLPVEDFFETEDLDMDEFDEGD